MKSATHQLCDHSECIHWWSHTKKLLSEWNGIVCSAYFLSSCLAQNRSANLFAAISRQSLKTFLFSPY